MNIVDIIKDYVINECEKYKNNAIDHYDFWNEHIKYVYEESIKLSLEYNADMEIVALGSLLHDMALVLKIGDKKDHHINGEIIAKEVLTKYNYDSNKLDKVLKCVLHHRSSKNAQNIEELCVADADILAHFDNVPMLINSIIKKNNCNIDEAKEILKEVFEDDYNDLSDRTKETFKDKYESLCNEIFNNIKR